MRLVQPRFSPATRSNDDSATSIRSCSNIRAAKPISRPWARLCSVSSPKVRCLPFERRRRPLTQMESRVSALPDPLLRSDCRVDGGRVHWSLADIPWHAIRHDAVPHGEALFFLVAAASLMESATDLYTQNLIEYFVGDDEVTSWLEQHWLPEELQHG